MTGDWTEAELGYEDEVIGRNTVPALFLGSVDRHGDAPCQQYKGGLGDRSMTPGVAPEPPAGEYGILSYAEVGRIVRNLAVGFRELGMEPGDRVGLYADTRPEWIQADLAVQAAEGVVTTVYTESSEPQVEYLLDDPGASGVIAGTPELVETITDVEAGLDLEFIVTLDEAGEYADRDDVYTLAEVHAMGETGRESGQVDEWVTNRSYDDLASLVYTSGTTGDPKGVQLTHENLREAINTVWRRVGPRPDKPDDVPTMEHGMTVLSFLPLAHVFERFNHFVQLGAGLTIAYAESPDTVGEDMAQVEPDGAASVPRVYERIFDRMREQASESDIGKRIFEWSVETAKAYDDAESPGVRLRLKMQLADRLVFSKVRETLGGNVELFISGGGSLSKGLAKMYRAMGLTILEGYGMTESAPVISLNPPEDIRVGTMGPALSAVDYRLDGSVVGPEQKKAETGDVGELLVKGPNITDGYWNKPDRTEAAFTEDGYFRTGDVVAVDEGGYFTFVDRVKQLIVLDTGKNIAPEPIEDEFATSARVDQIMVVGQDQKFIGAIVVPNFDRLEDWADDEGIDLPDDPVEICRDERVRGWVGEEIDGINGRLGHHETVKEFRLVPREWTADNDLLTPSMKKKRRDIVAENREAIADIYDKPPGEVSG
ncbi:long-chain fatty acid--CoA ligase [Haloglomus irregulare]|jgi:long-chain acyl-CoA synthetase|uniref:Long-chain fatty acid--CoA ligase n=1 Tax=Haloglomus irregulare TaxID=2234134 RepID=A0A554N7S2_9EURY|nr:long-chain fatty acid--CoA ligase [Haloglomus irregulare]TSD13319.1 long-chain fatty acid--CoA ligase [Haloglomus irregulare]